MFFYKNKLSNRIFSAIVGWSIVHDPEHPSLDTELWKWYRKNSCRGAHNVASAMVGTLTSSLISVDGMMGTDSVETLQLFWEFGMYLPFIEFSETIEDTEIF